MKIILSFLFIASLLSGCSLLGSRPADPNAVVADERSDFNFDNVNASGAFDIAIKSGEKFAVVVEGTRKQVDSIKTEVTEMTLVVRSKESYPSPNERIRVNITMPEIKRVEAFGATDVRIEGVNTDVVQLRAGGSSKIAAAGHSRLVKADGGGDARIDASNLDSEKAEVSAKGSTEISVNPAFELAAEALGAATVTYMRDVKITSQKAAGAGKIVKK